jgi:hypothetical protein
MLAQMLLINKKQLQPVLPLPVVATMLSGVCYDRKLLAIRAWHVLRDQVLYAQAGGGCRQRDTHQHTCAYISALPQRLPHQTCVTAQDLPKLAACLVASPPPTQSNYSISIRLKHSKHHT